MYNPRRQSIPDDLVNEILLRLDVKSLLRLKRVCKNWCDTINSPCFVDNHFNHHTNISRLLVYHEKQNPPVYDPDFGYGPDAFDSDSDSDTDETPFSIFLDETLTEHSYFDGFPTISTQIKPDIIGSVKGIFLFHYPGEFSQAALLNPATRELMPIVVPFSYHDYFRIRYQMLGLGFDPLNRDIKVVTILCGDEPCIGKPRVAVYSLAKDSWKYLHLNPKHDPLHKKKRICERFSGTQFMNDTCYWILTAPSLSGERSQNYYLLSFNLANQVIQEIKGPEYQYHLWNTTLVLFNDSIAILSTTYHDLQHIDLMVMKTEGCWTKHLTVDLRYLGKEQVHPRCVWNNSLILLLDDDDDSRYGNGNGSNNDLELVLYDQSTHEVKELRIHGCSHAFVYKESLVSLKGRKLYHQVYSFQDIFSDTSEVTHPKEKTTQNV